MTQQPAVVTPLRPLVKLLLLLAALACAVVAELVALGVDLGGSSWQQWVAGALIAYFASVLA